MKNVIRRRGKRGGSAVRESLHTIELKDIHASIRGVRKRQDGHNLHGTSVTALVMESGHTSVWSDIEETVQDHIVPRKSLTKKQYLGLFPADVELEPIKGRQLDPATGNMIDMPRNRVTWRQDKTLLNQAKPFDAPLDRLYLHGSVSVGANNRKTIRRDHTNIPMTETVLGPAIDVTFDPD